MSAAIYTIGHSTRSIEHFIAILQSFGIRVLADVRSMPGSKWQQQYNRSALERSLNEAGIQYVHIPELGGKRKMTNAISEDALSNKIPGYAAYMKTTTFAAGITQLEEIALKEPTVYMCAEADWRHCHRAMISDHLYDRNWQILHLSDVDKGMKHIRSMPPQVQGNLFL